MSERRVALIGLGNMGVPIGSRWVAAGERVVGFDLSDSARTAFRERGGEFADSAGEAASGADVVVLLLPDSTVVDAVLGDLLAQGAVGNGSVVIDMSSSEPQHTQRNAELAAAAGAVLLDAPVSGGVAGAQAGTLTVMVGGDAATVETHRTLLENLGKVVHVGDVGSGHAVKALNNLLSAIHLWATSEAVVIGERFGVRPEVLLEVVNGSSGRSGSSEAKWPKFILTESYDSGFSARLMLKDARIAAQLASTLGVPTHLGEEAVAEWARAVADLAPSADHTEIARWIRERSRPVTT
jgi:3-hydroxyisobutyrate dehydrogenase